MICPKCKTDRAHRSHRRGWTEHAAGMFNFYPYRCHGCEHRFVQRRKKEPVEAAQSATEREIRATRKAVGWKRKKREFLLYGSCFLLFLAFLYYLTRERPVQPENTSTGQASAPSVQFARSDTGTASSRT